MDELLCEYVDGTMDPGVRRVFEEYLRTDPDLAVHVDELKRTRALLCAYQCQMHAPTGFHRRIYREVTEEMMQAQEPLLASTSYRLRQATSLTSIAVAMMLVGFVSGSLLAEGDQVTGATVIVSSEGGEARSEALQGAALRPAVRHSAFGSLSRGGMAPSIEAALVRPDTQLVRSFEFESLRALAVSAP